MKKVGKKSNASTNYELNYFCVVFNSMERISTEDTCGALHSPKLPSKNVYVLLLFLMDPTR